jgi:hypothetical protein
MMMNLFFGLRQEKYEIPFIDIKGLLLQILVPPIVAIMIGADSATAIHC